MQSAVACSCASIIEPSCAGTAIGFVFPYNTTKHKRGVRENVGWGCTPESSGPEVIGIHSPRQFVMRPQ